jgi:hypothetical protein
MPADPDLAGVAAPETAAPLFERVEFADKVTFLGRRVSFSGPRDVTMR